MRAGAYLVVVLWIGSVDLDRAAQETVVGDLLNSRLKAQVTVPSGHTSNYRYIILKIVHYIPYDQYP